MGLTVTADIPAALENDLLGKAVTDLQEDITVSNYAITGSLKYVTDYTGFSGKTAERSGNYLALYVDVPDVEGVTYVAHLLNGFSGPVTLDSDQVIVFRIADAKTQRVAITASKEGCRAVTKVYTLDQLVCEAAE